MVNTNFNLIPWDPESYLIAADFYEEQGKVLTNAIRNKILPLDREKGCGKGLGSGSSDGKGRIYSFGSGSGSGQNSGYGWGNGFGHDHADDDCNYGNRTNEFQSYSI